MQTEAILQQLGVSEISARLYMSILQMHRATIAGLSNETGIYRPAIYKHLPELLEKGLVSKVKVGKRTMYIAENPERIQSLVGSLASQLEENMSELSRLYEGSQQRPIIRYYEGKKAIQGIYEEMIRRSKRGDAIYRYESPRNFQAVGNYYPRLYWQRSTGPTGEIEKYVITNEATSSKRRERLWRHTKSIPASFDSFDYNITQLIYKDTVAFIDFDTETATVIQNRRFADFQLKLFRLLFKKL